jgi:hypothetical protein
MKQLICALSNAHHERTQKFLETMLDAKNKHLPLFLQKNNVGFYQ